jgi:hypothetical protein
MPLRCLLPRIYSVVHQARGRQLRAALCTLVKPATSTRHVIVSTIHVETPVTLLSDVVASELSISGSMAQDMIEFGSVYVNEQPGTNTPTKRRMVDMHVHEGCYVRIYPEGGRYDVASVDWQEAVLFQNEDFVVVNKPPGIPCGPTTSNFHENVMECVRKVLDTDLSKCEKPPLPSGRGDIWRAGVWQEERVCKGVWRNHSEFRSGENVQATTGDKHFSTATARGSAVRRSSVSRIIICIIIIIIILIIKNSRIIMRRAIIRIVLYSVSRSGIHSDALHGDLEVLP